MAGLGVGAALFWLIVQIRPPKPDALVTVDYRGRIIEFNPASERTFGYRRDELLGQQVKNIIPDGFAERLVADGTRSAADAFAVTDPPDTRPKPSSVRSTHRFAPRPRHSRRNTASDTSSSGARMAGLVA